MKPVFGADHSHPPLPVPWKPDAVPNHTRQSLPFATILSANPSPLMSKRSSVPIGWFSSPLSRSE